MIVASYLGFIGDHPKEHGCKASIIPRLLVMRLSVRLEFIINSLFWSENGTRCKAKGIPTLCQATPLNKQPVSELNIDVYK